jgi:uncharacterized membrane protein YedE/YeeE
MDMITPVAKIFEWGDGTTGLLALFLGMGFGFFLEKAGFGSSKTIADFWYGRNFAVLRVMFSAIITAMLGLFAFHYLGWVNLEMVYINPTYLWPQIVGGVLFGFGFSVGSFCPGTAGAACATGKVDGWVFVAGFMVGVVIYGLVYPGIEGFANSGSMGRTLLSDTFALPIGVVVLIITVIGLGVFFLTHYLDRVFGNNKQ